MSDKYLWKHLQRVLEIRDIDAPAGCTAFHVIGKRTKQILGIAYQGADFRFVSVGSRGIYDAHSLRESVIELLRAENTLLIAEAIR